MVFVCPYRTYRGQVAYPKLYARKPLMRKRLFRHARAGGPPFRAEMGLLVPPANSTRRAKPLNLYAKSTRVLAPRPGSSAHRCETMLRRVAMRYEMISQKASVTGGEASFVPVQSELYFSRVTDHVQKHQDAV